VRYRFVTLGGGLFTREVSAKRRKFTIFFQNLLSQANNQLPEEEEASEGGLAEDSRRTRGRLVEDSRRTRGGLAGTFTIV